MIARVHRDGRLWRMEEWNHVKGIPFMAQSVPYDTWREAMDAADRVVIGRLRKLARELSWISRSTLST